jgi:hypothetical protein
MLQPSHLHEHEVKFLASVKRRSYSGPEKKPNKGGMAPAVFALHVDGAKEDAYGTALTKRSLNGWTI